MLARKFIVAGVTATTLLGGGVAAFAAGGPRGNAPSHDGPQRADHGQAPATDETATPTTSGTPTAKPTGKPMGGGPRGGHGMPGRPGFQHAESVSGSVAKGFVTTDTQFGLVTAASATSVTVLSADTFSKVYVIVSSTRTDFPRKSGKTAIAVGDTVDILATFKGGTDTARHISDHGTPVTKATATPSVRPSA